MNGVMTGGLAALGLHLDPIDCISIFFFVCKMVAWLERLNPESFVTESSFCSLQYSLSASLGFPP